MSQFCHNCGTKLPDDAVFCSGCGTRVKVAEQPAGVVSTNHIETVQPVVEPVQPEVGYASPIGKDRLCKSGRTTEGRGKCKLCKSGRATESRGKDRLRKSGRTTEGRGKDRLYKSGTANRVSSLYRRDFLYRRNIL